MIYALGLVLLLAGVFLIVLGCRLYNQPKVGEQISVWRGLLPVKNEPPQRFYQRLYQSLQSSLQDRLAEGDPTGQLGPVEVVLTGMGFGPHRLFAAPSLMAERPLYLLVRYKHLRCYIYAGQTPTGLFVSSWGYSDYHVGEGGLQRLLPHKRAWSYFAKQTLFQVDAALMFTHSVHELLCEIIDGYREERGLQPLEALEKRPILHAFYQNPFYRDHYSSHAPASMPAGTSSQGYPVTGYPAAGYPAASDPMGSTPVVNTPVASTPAPGSPMAQPTPLFDLVADTGVPDRGVPENGQVTSEDSVSEANVTGAHADTNGVQANGSRSQAVRGKEGEAA